METLKEDKAKQAEEIEDEEIADSVESEDVEEQEAESEQPEAEGETPEQTEKKPESEEADDKSEDNDEEGELIIEIEGESPAPNEDEDDRKNPELPKKLRGVIKDKDRALREIDRKLKQREKELDELKNQLNPDAGKLRDKPTLEGHDYDGKAYEADLEKWFGEKKADDEKKAKQAAKQEEETARVKERLDAYKERKEAISKRVPDYDVHVSEAEETFSPVQRDAIAYYFKERAAELMYAIGKNPDNLRKLSSMTDPVELLLAVKDVQSAMKVTTRKPSTNPETTISGQTRISNSEAYLEKLEEEADRTGNRTKITAYKRELREKARAKRN